MQLTDRTAVRCYSKSIAFGSECGLAWMYYHDKVQEDADETENVLPTGYTAAGIARLRAQFTPLHTYHYTIEAGTSAKPQHLEAFQCATILQLCAKVAHILPVVMKHCHQMQVLAMLYDEYTEERVWLSVDQLMDLARCYPQLRVIVSEKNQNGTDLYEVDYSTVKKAFPQLRFTDDLSILGFDVLSMPV